MTAFSNGTEWDRWSDRWCATCSKDSMGLGPAAPEVFCPIVTDAMMGGRPEQWREDQPDSPTMRYTCTEYAPRDSDEDARTMAGPDAMRSVPE